jgi:hypothetical protein
VETSAFPQLAVAAVATTSTEVELNLAVTAQTVVEAVLLIATERPMQEERAPLDTTVEQETRAMTTPIT